MSSQKPITPLPWELRDTKILHRIGGDNILIAAVSVEKAANGAYIVRACNAYPRLVEALRYIARGYSGSAGNIETHSGTHCAEYAVDILRELGEIE